MLFPLIFCPLFLDLLPIIFILDTFLLLEYSMLSCVCVFAYVGVHMYTHVYEYMRMEARGYH